MNALNLQEASLVEAVRKNLAELIERTKKGQTMGGRPRILVANVSSRAKWLLSALHALEEGELPAAQDDGRAFVIRSLATGKYWSDVWVAKEKARHYTTAAAARKSASTVGLDNIAIDELGVEEKGMKMGEVVENVGDVLRIWNPLQLPDHWVVENETDGTFWIVPAVADGWARRFPYPPQSRGRGTLRACKGYNYMGLGVPQRRSWHEVCQDPEGRN